MRRRRWHGFLLSMAVATTAIAQPRTLREAAALDEQGKCAESETFYRKALAAGEPAMALLNNAGNHYLVCGEPAKARAHFERLLKLSPAHANANLQLARLAAVERRGEAALAYLERVRGAEPAVRILRAEALFWANRRDEAAAALDQLEREAGDDPRMRFSLGLTFGRLGLYDRAETAFHALLVRRPDDFDVLFQFGRAAARNRHFDRARPALETAVRMRPGDADAMLELGLAHAGSNDFSRAVYVLAQARAKAPGRADIVLALARAAEDAGFYGDSALAYDEYVRLKPEDHTARRDRGRVLALTGSRLDDGLREMEAFLAKHLADPQGHYNLAQFTWRTDPVTSLNQLAEALRLDPKFAPAHVSRAWLLHRLGRSSEAVPHLLAALEVTPSNVRALDQLGLAYLALGRPADAEKALRRALSAGPADLEVQMHLGRALMELGRDAEAEAILDQYRQSPANRNRDPRREPGMIELAVLGEAGRTHREIERLRGLSRARPDDPVLQLHLAQLLLASGRGEEALLEFRRLLEFNADAGILEQAGRSLLAAEQYHLARQLLERAAADRPGARLDLGLALLHTGGADAALQAIGKMPEGPGAGDFLLVKARILDAAGRRDEAAGLLTEGLRRPDVRPDVARQAAMMLLRDGRVREALEFTARSIAQAPDDAGLMLAHAIVLAAGGEEHDAAKRLTAIESRWPEWDRPYVIHGLLLESGSRPEEAVRKLKIAVALGARDAAVHCAIARITDAPGPQLRCTCPAGIREFLFGRCGAP